MEKQRGLQDIDMLLATAQCGGDQTFLMEILPELLEEVMLSITSIDKSIQEIQLGENIKHHLSIIQAASHTIKGSSSNLACYYLTQTSKDINESVKNLQKNASIGSVIIIGTLNPLIGELKLAAKSFERTIESIQSK